MIVWVGFYDISTIVGYSMPNPFKIYIYVCGLVGFYGLSILVGFLIPNLLYIYDWVEFYGISTIVGYLMPNPLYTYILDIYDLVGLGFTACQLL